MSHEIYLREAIRLAVVGMEAGAGGPFGCVIVRDGQILGQGHNRVLATNDPTAHAEVVAIRDACARAASPHLPGAIVYASCEPCPMCLAACYWARAERVIFGATAQDAAAAGFADEFIRDDLRKALDARALQLEQLLPVEARAPFEAWVARLNRQIY